MPHKIKSNVPHPCVNISHHVTCYVPPQKDTDTQYTRWLYINITKKHNIIHPENFHNYSISVWIIHKHNKTKKNAHRRVIFGALGTLRIRINILATIIDWWTEMARLLHSLIPIDGVYYVLVWYALTLTFALFRGTICSSNNTVSIWIKHFPSIQFIL